MPVLVRLQAERCSIEYEEEVEVFVPVGTGEVQFKDAKRAAVVVELAETMPGMDSSRMSAAVDKKAGRAEKPSRR